MPPNQVMVGMALFLTFFVMSPVWQQVNREAIQPYLAREISEKEAMTKAMTPIRSFMLRQTREKDLSLFVDISKGERPKNVSEISTLVIVPAFVISELKTAFQIGFFIYIPFLVLDMVVASVLLSMGMLMLNGCKKSEPVSSETSSDTMQGHEGHEHAAIETEPAAVAASITEQKTCPVMGGAINKDLFTEYKGKKVYFCCEGCEERFLENPEQYVAKLPQFKK